MSKEKLEPFQQATLFQYLCENGLPKWAEGDERKVFAKLMNFSQDEANAAYEQAFHAGYMDKKGVTP